MNPLTPTPDALLEAIAHQRATLVDALTSFRSASRNLDRMDRDIQSVSQTLDDLLQARASIVAACRAQLQMFELAKEQIAEAFSTLSLIEPQLDEPLLRERLGEVGDLMLDVEAELERIVKARPK